MRSSLSNQSFNSQELQQARSEQQRESDRLKLLLDMTNTLVSNLEPRDLLRAISVSIRKDMHCDVVGVWLPDQERRQLRQLVMDFPGGKGMVKEGLLRPVEGSFVGSAFKTGKALIATLADFTKDPTGGDAARGEGIQSGLALPLISRNRTLGVMTLASRVEKSFSQDDVDFLVRAAGQEIGR